MALCGLLRSSWSRSWAPLTTRASSWWSQVEVGPPDPIFGLVEAFNKDPKSTKVNLTIGAYRDDKGKPYVLPVVNKVEQALQGSGLDKEYAGIMGYPSFQKAATEFALTPENSLVKSGMYVSAQALGGTGALRIVGSYLAKFFPYKKTIYVSKPTWGNHVPIFKNCGLDVEFYRHYDPKTCGFDAPAAYEDLNNIPDNSIVLFHACGHNPTGVDPTPEQWKELSQICKRKNHFIVMDMAYQGFATGDLDRDASALRMLVNEGHQIAYCQSFSKNMGLYGERVGAATILCSNEEEKKAVESQMKIIIRPMYSNPPINGARVATEILNNPSHRAEWLVQMKGMADRILDMRSLLKSELEKQGSTRDWSHVTKQIGMFCYSGLSTEQVDKLRTEYGVYMTKDGRISIVSLTSANVGYTAESMHKVTK